MNFSPNMSASTLSIDSLTEANPIVCGSITLRHDQSVLLNEARECFKQRVTRLLVQASTGFGKTVVMAAMIKLALDKNPSATIAIGIHRQSLILSTLKRLEEAGIDPNHIDVVQGCGKDAFFPGAETTRVWICMLQTLESSVIPAEVERDVNDFSDGGTFPRQLQMVFLDEAHETVFHRAGQWLAERSPLLIGFSATPDRAGRESLGQFFQAAIASPSHRQLVRQGDLRPCEYAELSLDDAQATVFEGKKEKDDDAETLSFARLVAKPEAQDRIIALSEERIQEYAARNHGTRKAIVFAPSQDAAEALAIRWADKLGKGRVGYILSGGCGVVGTWQSDRDSIVNSFAQEDSGLDVLVSVRAIAVGFDVPIASVAIFLSKFSLLLWVQGVGRVVRRFPKCASSLILDFAGNLAAHGPVEEQEWNPECYLAIPEEKPKLEALTKLCPECDKQHALTVRVCKKEDGGCGYVFPRKELQEQLVDWEAANLKTLHTALWVEIAASSELQRDRFLEVARDKFYAMRSEPCTNPAKQCFILRFKAWLKEFGRQIQEGDPSFVIPVKESLCYSNLAEDLRSYLGMPPYEKIPSIIAPRIVMKHITQYATPAAYWNNMVILFGRKNIERVVLFAQNRIEPPLKAFVQKMTDERNYFDRACAEFDSANCDEEDVDF